MSYIFEIKKKSQAELDEMVKDHEFAKVYAKSVQGSAEPMR